MKIEYTIQSRGTITRDITNIGRFDDIETALQYLEEFREAHKTREHKILFRECGDWQDWSGKP